MRSCVVSAAIGVPGCGLLLGLQWPLGEVSRRLANSGHASLKLLWEDAMYTVTFVVLGFLWRGVWCLNSLYVLPQIPLGSWVNFLVGSAGLLALQTFTIVCNWGMCEDGLDAAGEAFYPVSYIRAFCNTQRNTEGTTTVSSIDFHII